MAEAPARRTPVRVWVQVLSRKLAQAWSDCRRPSDDRPIRARAFGAVIFGSMFTVAVARTRVVAAHQFSANQLCKRQDKYSPPSSAVTLVTLPGVTDAATMRKISYWRYSAVNRTTLFAALICALLVFSMLGCGSTKKLQSVQLSTSSESETSTSGLSLTGISANIQLYAWANYSNGKSVLIHGNEITWTIVLDPIYNVDAYGNLLPPPPQVVQLSTTGLATAVDPAYCTWVDTAEVTQANPTPTPAWAISGAYDVTATFQGMVTPVAEIAVADTGGSPEYPPGDGTNLNNPSGLCGPSATP